MIYYPWPSSSNTFLSVILIKPFALSFLFIVSKNSAIRFSVTNSLALLLINTYSFFQLFRMLSSYTTFTDSNILTIFLAKFKSSENSKVLIVMGSNLIFTYSFYHSQEEKIIIYSRYLTCPMTITIKERMIMHSFGAANSIVF